MFKLLLEVSKLYHINPFILFGLLLLGYTGLGFSKRNSELHDLKDKEIERLKIENRELRNELALFKSIKKQVEMNHKK